ncbi:MAG TPA: hypothetical protein EYH45_06585 [Candidatus Caldiarchaeum subterraneum]|uniref:Uncharacterized protein n=1 Tax=Caldiarchaeum subterraneum TaxID=311458 RepID=A0A833EA70_CALS0|nr:hypothetical protein [Candidatus Caldarchaeum subterraneum]
MGVVLCDACSREVATIVDGIDEGLDIGYALVIEGYITEVICEECRRKYLNNKPINNTLEEAEEKE